MTTNENRDQEKAIAVASIAVDPEFKRLGQVLRDPGALNEAVTGIDDYLRTMEQIDVIDTSVDGTAPESASEEPVTDTMTANEPLVAVALSPLVTDEASELADPFAVALADAEIPGDEGSDQGALVEEAFTESASDQEAFAPIPEGPLQHLDPEEILRNAIATGMTLAPNSSEDASGDVQGSAAITGQNDVQGDVLVSGMDPEPEHGADAHRAGNPVDMRKALKDTGLDEQDFASIGDAIEPDEMGDELAATPADLEEVETAGESSLPSVDGPGLAEHTITDPGAEVDPCLEPQAAAAETPEAIEGDPDATSADEWGDQPEPEAWGDIPEQMGEQGAERAVEEDGTDDTQTSDEGAPQTSGRSNIPFMLAAAAVAGVIGLSVYSMLPGRDISHAPALSMAGAMPDEVAIGEPSSEMLDLRQLAAFGIEAQVEVDQVNRSNAGVDLQAIARGTDASEEYDLADLFLGAETAGPIEEAIEEGVAEVEAVVGMNDFEALARSVETLDANSRDLFNALGAQAQHVARIEAGMNAALERAERAEALALAQNQVLVRFVAAEEKLEMAEQLIVDLSRRIAAVEGIDPADREDMNTRLADLDERMRGLQRDVGMVARMAINGSSAAMPGRAASGQANFDRAEAASLASPVARPENVPADVSVGDFVNGYGSVLEIFATADGGRMVVMENGSVILN